MRKNVLPGVGKINRMRPFFFAKFVLDLTLPDQQKFVNGDGTHTAAGEQHELITHKEVFDVQVYETLLHGSKSEQSIPGIQ